MTLRAEGPDRDRLTRPLAVALTVAAAVWAVTLLVVPLQASSGRSPFLVAAAHAAGALVCHQRPDRSFQVAGARLPVCARCTGLYLSGAAGALAGWFGLAQLPRRRRTVFAVVALPTAVSVLGEWAGALTSSNGLRTGAALPLGAYAGWLFVRMLRAEGARTTCAMIAERMATKSTAAERARPVSEPGTLVLLCLAAWAVPGAGHFWLGRIQKSVVFLLALTTMFVTGLLLRGRLFPFEFSEPLVALAALANAGLGLPWILGRTLGLGAGTVTSVTYEYGNTFLIVAGLLNFLVVLDAYDLAAGRK